MRETARTSPERSSSRQSFSLPQRGKRSRRRLHGQDLVRRPGALATMLGTAGAVLEGRQVGGVVAFPPAVEGLATDVEMAAGAAHILTVSDVPVEPVQAALRLGRELDQAQARDRELGAGDTENSHVVILGGLGRGAGTVRQGGPPRWGWM